MAGSRESSSGSPDTTIYLARAVAAAAKPLRVPCVVEAAQRPLSHEPPAAGASPGR